MRKRCNRKRIVALPPRGLRPMLDAGQLRDLGLVHMANLDILSGGQANETTLWHVVEGVLTWSRVADALKWGVAEMDAQLAMTTRLVEHYRDTGRIEFVAGDYELAKTGTIVMDLLAESVDRATAIAAAVWSETQIKIMSEGCHV